MVQDDKVRLPTLEGGQDGKTVFDEVDLMARGPEESRSIRRISSLSSARSR
jgi:hypothetical protein